MTAQITPKTQAQIDRMVEDGKIAIIATEQEQHDSMRAQIVSINNTPYADILAAQKQAEQHALATRKITRAEISARNRAEFARQAAETAQQRYLAALDELQQIEQHALRNWAIEQARKQP